MIRILREASFFFIFEAHRINNTEIYERSNIGPASLSHLYAKYGSRNSLFNYIPDMRATRWSAPGA